MAVAMIYPDSGPDFNFHFSNHFTLLYEFPSRAAQALRKRVIFSKIVCTHRGGWREAPNQPLNLSQHVLELIPVSFEAFAHGHNLCIAASFWWRKRYRGQVRIPLVFVERCELRKARFGLLG